MRGTLAALGGGGTPAAGALGPSQSHPLPASRYCVGKALRVLVLLEAAAYKEVLFTHPTKPKK